MESRRRRNVWLSSGLLLILIAVVILMIVRRERHGLPEGAPLPSFSLKDHRAREYRSADLWGKVSIVVFWKISVEASVAEIKGLEELWEEYHDRGFEVLAIALDTNEGAYVKSFELKHRIKIPLLIGDVATAHLFGGIRGVPTLFLFDRGGRLREVIEGFRDKGALESKILDLL
jgi:peroxiredoxin